ncbi:low molecular weight protein-tyrosine-phosphatase [Roseibium sp.]|uniref:low molecular weight protein-tyrosine-phosphatase n=1 Tax=Roseibium sp. TaxID=1936156 RepID=UPI003A97DA6E
MTEAPIRSILFVCLGNICRSPLAEGVFHHVLSEAGNDLQMHLDSAGTGAWHAGNPPDPRSIEVAAKYGIDISAQRARQVVTEDFDRFDLILAMDKSNLRNLRSLQPKTSRAMVRLFLASPATDVPDPYYGHDDGFETVYQMLHAGSRALLSELAGS